MEPLHNELHLSLLGNGDVSKRIAELHDNLGTIGAVGAPARQRAAASVRSTLVGIERLCKVSPVGRHLLLDGIILLGERVSIGIGVESIQCIHNFRLVEGTLVLAWWGVGPVVGVERGGGGLVPVGGVGPGANEGGIAGSCVPSSICGACVAVVGV